MENKTFSERLNLICKGSWWKRIDDGAIGTVLEVCDDNSNNLIVRWTHPNIEGSRAGTYNRYEFARKWVPLESYQDNNPIKGSIWKSKTSNEYVRIELTAEGLIHFRPLTNNKSPRDIESMCRKRFLEDFKFEKDDDTLALYVSDDDENQFAIVTDHGSYPERLVCKFINMEKFKLHTRVVGLSQFYQQYHLLSLDSLHEYRIMYDSIESIEQLKDKSINESSVAEITVGSIWKEVRGCAKEHVGSLVKVTAIFGDIISWARIGYDEKDEGSKGSTCLSSFLYCFERFCDPTPSWPGAIWYHTNGGIHVAISIKYENGTVWFVSSDNKALDLYWTMPFEEWAKIYKFYDGVVKPPCLPKESFDKLIEDTKGRYERVMERLKEGESKMENSKETYLKTDESKMKKFDTGAKREDKSGKGRYDLIPGDVMADFVNYAWEAYFIEGPTTICDTDISLNAYFDDVTDEKLFFEFILNMTCMFFTDHEKLDEITDSVGERAYVVTWEDFHTALYKMRELLAKHYEAGAKVHGVNNWKKGIPVSDSERGGNFVDSMRRHTDQALRGLDDEPHAVAAIWNAFCAIWTIRNCK